MAGPPSGSYSASKPYLRRECMPFSGLVLLAPLDYRCWAPIMLLSAAMPRCGSGGGAVLGPRVVSSPLPAPLMIWTKVFLTMCRFC